MDTIHIQEAEPRTTGNPPSHRERSEGNEFARSFVRPFVRCCCTSTETVRTVIRDGCPRTATSTFTQLLSSVRVLCPELCSSSMLLFTATKTVWTIIRDGCPRTATSTFTQLLSSVRVQCCFYGHRDRTGYY